MFNYHDSNSCVYDIWAPQPNSAVENRAFSPFAKHSQEIEDVIEMIGAGALGDIQIDDDFTDNDLRYIERKVKSRYGFDVVLENN